VGVIAVGVIVYATINAARTEGPGSRGVPAGERMPPFAAPLAASDLEGDANVATRPDSGAEGERPACEVRGPKILNICQLYERGPVVLVFFTPGSEQCEDQLDTMRDFMARDPRSGVRFAALSIRGNRDELRTTIAQRRWRFPVGYDRDGAVANRYGVAVCPTTIFAHRGGVVMESVVGEMGPTQFAGRVRQLVRGGTR
jgi:hypothetical protein